MFNNLSDDSFTQLEELKRWQQLKQKQLYEKQQEEHRRLSNEQQAKIGNDLRLINRNSSNSITSLNSSQDLGSGETTIQTPLKLKESTNFVNDQLDVDTKITKKPFLKRGEGLKSRFGVDPDIFKLNNIPKYKYTRRSNNRSQVKNRHKEIEQTEGKNKETLLEYDEIPIRPKQKCDKILQRNLDDKNDDSCQLDSHTGYITWAKNLDPLIVESPGVVSSFNANNSLDNTTESQQNQNELDLFERLEQKVDNSSFGSNTSSILRLLSQQDKKIKESRCNYPENDRRQTIQNTINNSALIPDPKELLELISSSDDDDDDVEERAHVRFNENVQVTEIRNEELDYESEDNTGNFEDEDETTVADIQNNSNTSTPNAKSPVGTLHSEHVPFATGNLANIIQNFVESKERELFEKNELLKTRLKDLENEIENFQKQSQILTKMKQEHELEKLEMENYFRVTKERLDDERIKIEIYLKDEKSKLIEERSKLEKKTTIPSRKDREEITKLKQQIADLQEEIKTKENRHLSHQSRLRAQIRNLEKSLREKELEIEAVKKENKKLDSENIRLRRANNNKMLSEINKNIAKLTTKEEETTKTGPEKPPPISTVTQTKSTKSKKKVESESESTSSSSTSSSSEDTYQEDNESTEVLSQKSAYLSATASNSQVKRKSKSPPPQHQEPVSQKQLATTSVPGTSALNLKREISNQDGSRDIWYPNGNIKKISPDGLNIKMLYYNKDIKETDMGEGTVRYYYAATNTWHTTYLDGLEILEYPNGQTEHRFRDGKVEVHFPNGSVRLTSPIDKEVKEEWRYPDGTLIKILTNGEKIVLMPNGQKEIHTTDHKRREYPDGTVKIVYTDGSQETRYSNGRVRLKDKDGKLVMDSDMVIS